jgi:nucleotide-binding universal stress UspA family protein
MKELMVPLDGSPAGETALEVAVALASLSGARVHVVHVAEPVSDEPMGVERFPVEPWCEKYLQALVARMEADADVEIEAAIVDGDVTDALLGHARTVAADLVVMATHGHGPPSRFWLGSVTNRYLRTTQGPVLVVRPEHGRTVKEEGLRVRKIVVPLDGSEGSEKALVVASSVARLTDAELSLLRVVELPMLPRATSDIDLAGPEGSQVDRAESYLATVAEGIAPGTVVSTTAVRSHIQPAVAILDFVQEWSGDMVVICTRGLGVARRLFLGSVTDKVVRGATVPVLVVPRRDE